MQERESLHWHLQHPDRALLFVDSNKAVQLGNLIHYTTHNVKLALVLELIRCALDEYQPKLNLLKENLNWRYKAELKLNF